MKLDVYSLAEMKTVNLTVPHVIISCMSPELREEYNGPEYNDHTLDIVNLDFDDADTGAQYFIKDTEVSRNAILFDEDMASKILDAYYAHKNDAELFVAHCHAGRSRSAGVIAAMSKIHLNDDFHWFCVKTPNMHVYRTILKTWCERV